MRKSLFLHGIVGLLAVIGTSAVGLGSAQAQEPDFNRTDYVPVQCGGGIATDPLGDESGANDDRDIVGSAPDQAALFLAVDDNFLYLRMRLDATPRQGGGYAPFGWGWEFDTDGDLNTYEFLIILNGVTNPDQVEVRRNSFTTAVGDPSDRADDPPLFMYPASTHATVTNAGSMIGGNDDFFLDIAIPLADLQAAGVPFGSTIVWAGSSANGQSLSQDLTCHDGMTGEPNLAEIASDPVVVGTFIEIDSPSEGEIADSMPTITGRAEPGATVMVSIDGGAAITVMADGSGNWTLTVPSALADGAHTIVATTTNANGLTATVTRTFQVGNDSDGDGLIDPVEQPGGVSQDTDGDGTPDHLDTDDDGDGVPTSTEAPDGAQQDSDDDGIADHRDPDDDGDYIPTATERADEITPVDGDNLPAYLDTDSDGDMSLDRVEGTEDEDGDGIPNYLDPTTTVADTDGDGIADAIECPAEPCRDSDGDGIVDSMDADDDNDGLPTYFEMVPGIATDTDGDGVLDYLDTDDDGDGIPTATEAPGGVPQDTDDDGILDHLDPAGAAGDADGDGLEDSVECPSTPCRDTDGDGIVDSMDADDDGDGILTSVEFTAAQGRDVDGDGIENHLDTDSDGDGVLDSIERTADDDGDGAPNYLDSDGTVLTSGGLSGGAVCSASAPGSSNGGVVVLALLGLMLLVIRRRRLAAGALVVAIALCAPTPTLAQSVQLDQFRPAETPRDGFAVSRPDDLGHLNLGAQLYLDYALNPLVYETSRGDAGTEIASVVEHQFAAHLGLSFGLFDRLVVFAGLPVNLVMVGADPAPAGVFGADGSTLGDFSLGARGRIFGEQDDLFSLGAQITAGFPTARAANGSSHWSGEDGLTLVPELLGELRPADGWRITANLGARFRTTDQARFAGANALDVSHELTWGLGLTARLMPDDFLLGYVEAYGSATFENFDRETSPVEILAGAKLQPIPGLWVGLGVATGLSRGYGSPDFRALATVGWAGPLVEDTRRAEPGPGDRDGDGIGDGEDQCPDEPEDDDDFEDENGCPDPDNDQDGVLDVNDGAPMEPEDRDEFEDTDGVPDPDNDRDGVLDASDGAPLDPEDRDSFQDEDGVPDPDNDQDTVLDPQDRCPLDPGRPEDNGCPQAVRVDRESGTIFILQRVEFATNRDVILERSFPILEEVRGVLNANPTLRRIRIEGHTDNRGVDARNLELSRRRAASVMRWLVEHGIQATRVEGWGCGELHPRETNDTDAGRQANRRVEFFIADPAPAGGARTLEGCVQAQ